ncbi:hypothetical protein MMC27_000085 [Xylographa pallens]|nr:hypothetical protein [Xylographa pallens]
MTKSSTRPVDVTAQTNLNAPVPKPPLPNNNIRSTQPTPPNPNGPLPRQRNMADKAGINRSLSTIRTELEYLRDSGVLNPAQFNSIFAQLPVSPETNIPPPLHPMPSLLPSPPFTHPSPPSPPPKLTPPSPLPQQQGGIPSQYIDPHYGGQQMMNPGAIAQQAQDPNSPANPAHPNVRLLQTPRYPISYSYIATGKVLAMREEGQWEEAGDRGRG